MTVEPELRQLRTFVAVADERHFTRAAKRLNVGQQAVSAQIRNLEARLGVRLFQRTTREVELTDAGRALLAQARPLLLSASRAWEEVVRAAAGEVGEVSISYAPTARDEILPRVLQSFHARYPHLLVRTCEAWLGADAVRDGFADVALTRSPASADGQIEFALIRESILGVVRLADHRTSGEPGVDIEQLANTPLELPARRFSREFHDLIVSSLSSRGFAAPVREYENLSNRFLHDDKRARDEIISGEAFGVAFKNQYRRLPPGLVWEPIVPPLIVPMNLCWQHNPTSAVQNFVAIALEVARDAGWLAAVAEPARTCPIDADFIYDAGEDLTPGGN